MTAARVPAGTFLMPNIDFVPGPAVPGTPARQNTIRRRNNDNGAAVARNHHHHHHREVDTGPYRDEDVLLSLQLLAYLSK